MELTTYLCTARAPEVLKYCMESGIMRASGTAWDRY